MFKPTVRALSLLCSAGLLTLFVSCGHKPPVAPPPPPPPAPTPAPTPAPPPPPPPAPAPAPAPPPPPAALTPAEIFARTSLDALNNGILITDLPGPNNDLVYTAKVRTDTPITVAYVDPGTASSPLTVTTAGNAITVNLGKQGGQITSTAAQIAAAIAANPEANALVSVANKDQNNGTGVVTAMPASPLAPALADVFFDFDKADLTDMARTSLQKNADFMRQWDKTTIMIEGHADSRGTNEYNLALGERRAASTRDYLVSLGVDASRVNVVSKGEEQPFCREENEACWSRNRRGHFILTGK